MTQPTRIVQLTLCSMFPSRVTRQVITTTVTLEELDHPYMLNAHAGHEPGVRVGRPFYVRHVRDEHGGCLECGNLVSTKFGHKVGCSMPTAGEFAVELTP
jgi:hypothetical protein